jgi:transcriptional regulator with XRE-family HTH domain
MQTASPQVRFNGQLMAEDMALKGLSKLELALKAGVSDMTVIRFLRGERQTGKTARKLSKALGQRVERYLVRSREAVAS